MQLPSLNVLLVFGEVLLRIAVDPNFPLHPRRHTERKLNAKAKCSTFANVPSDFERETQKRDSATGPGSESEKESERGKREKEKERERKRKVR